MSDPAASPPTGPLRRTVGGARALDAGPTAPLHPLAREALLAALDEGWADPTRLHAAGQRARLLLDGAREAVAGVLGCRPDEVGWSSSGAAAAQWALLGTVAARTRTGSTVVTSAVEHSSVLYAAQHAAAQPPTPAPVAVAVDEQGRVDLAAFAAAVRQPGVAVAALQAANGEVGTLQPVQEAAQVCAAAGVPLLVDAAAAAGWLPLPGLLQPASLVTADAAGWGGPPGVGVVVRRTGTRWREPGPRSAAVPPVPLLVAAAAGLLAAEAERAELGARCARWTARLREQISGEVPDAVLAGPVDAAARLPHVLAVSLLYVDGERLVQALDAAGIAAASGSACVADTLEPSHVLAAMGVLTSGNLRLTLGRETRDDDVERLLAVLPPTVARLRSEAVVAGL